MRLCNVRIVVSALKEGNFNAFKIKERSKVGHVAQVRKFILVAPKRKFKSSKAQLHFLDFQLLDASLKLQI